MRAPGYFKFSTCQPTTGNTVECTVTLTSYTRLRLRASLIALGLGARLLPACLGLTISVHSSQGDA
jgi:hypothetical protein